MGLRFSVDDLESRHIQFSIAALQETLGKESPLDFSALEKWDALGSLESTRQARWIRSVQDVQI